MQIIRKKIHYIILFAILILAAFLRLYRIGDYLTFLGDEGRDVLVVYNILHGHLTLLGPTSSVGGFFLGPIYYYFMTPFLWIFNYNPVGPAIMVALFGIITVWFVYKIGRDFFNTATGLIAALLFTVSPVVIAYSRSSWNPNLMPIFTVFTLFALLKAIEKKKTSFFILSGFLFGILMQLHYLATFVGVIAGVYIAWMSFVLSENAKEWKPKIFLIIKRYLLFFGGFIAGWFPFLAFEVRHGFPNIKSIFSFVFHSRDVTAGGNFFSIVSDVFFRIFGRLATDFPPPEQVSLQAHTNIFVWYLLTLILGLISFGFFLWQYKKTFREKKKKFLQLSLVFLWFCIGILLFGLYKKEIYDYYFEFLFPLPFLFIGFFLSFLLQQKILLKIVGIVILVALFGINLQAMPFRYQPNRQLYQVEQISKFVLSKTNGRPYNFALLTSGNSDYAYRYFFTIWGDPPVTIQNPQVDPQRKSVTGQLLIVCETYPCAPLGNSLWEVAGFGRAEIAGKWNISVVQVYRLVPYTGK